MVGMNPRAAKIAALIQRVVATAMEREIADKRLSAVTITEVRVTNDLQIARIYWTQMGNPQGNVLAQRQRAKEALSQAQGRLRRLVASKAGLRITPQLEFIFDEVPAEAHDIEDIIAIARKRDEELAKARENASYAGDADPYRQPRIEEDDDLEDDFDYEDDFDNEESFEEDHFSTDIVEEASSSENSFDEDAR